MNKSLRKGIMVSLLSLSLVMSLATISLAAGSNMNGMDPNMPGMNMSGQSAAPPSASHEATPGMDPNMPGMEKNSQSKEEHGETGESEGVNWPVVGSFFGVDLLIIAVAGLKKWSTKHKLEILG